jgi:5-methylthioribose kinase
MLVHDQGFMLVDYETAHFGDPAMDIGLFLTHLMLKAVRRPELRDDYFELIQSFWRNYVKEIRALAIADLEWRGVAHWGACLLARIDGTSPVDYLQQDWQRELVRGLGRAVLLDGVASIANVIGLASSMLTAGK